ncbi:MAG: L-threonylcarbamoyladenylate synthase [Planctomycetota bacterium]|jgi:L-threonylcarbamoyladenylate synthase
MSVSDMERAVAAIAAGELVGMPTETVYGLAADATNAVAVAGIFAAKGRPHFDPLIVHVADAAQAWTVAEPCPAAHALAQALWPGPLTLVLPRRALVPDLVTSGLDTVAVRCPDHPLARELLQRCGRPLAAPSANLFGRISPTTAAAVREQLADAVAVVVDGGPCQVGVESTVLRLLDDEAVILRPGGVSPEQIAAVLGREPIVADRATVAAGLPAEAPGMLASHYAPRMPLRLREGAWPQDPDCGLLAWRGDDVPAGPRVEVLSSTGDLHEAATALFAAMRRLEAAGVTNIVAELVPAHGLGLAINDRLRRAAGCG